MTSRISIVLALLTTFLVSSLPASSEAAPLELAIHKMTGLPAANVGLKQRGFIREGYFADITIFDPKTVIDRATFEEPNQYPLGINFVIVNGQIEVDNGQRTRVLGGRVLRGPGYCVANRTPTLCAPSKNVVNLP